jgi:hypothetical protein
MDTYKRWRRKAFLGMEFSAQLHSSRIRSSKRLNISDTRGQSAYRFQDVKRVFDTGYPVDVRDFFPHLT